MGSSFYGDRQTTEKGDRIWIREKGVWLGPSLPARLDELDRRCHNTTDDRSVFQSTYKCLLWNGSENEVRKLTCKRLIKNTR